MLQKCDRGYWDQKYVENEWTGETEYRETWIESCNWQAVTTFRDECTVCGRSNHYTNTNGYPEESLVKK